MKKITYKNLQENSPQKLGVKKEASRPERQFGEANKNVLTNEVCNDTNVSEESKKELSKGSKKDEARGVMIDREKLCNACPNVQKCSELTICFRTLLNKNKYRRIIEKHMDEQYQLKKSWLEKVKHTLK